MAFVMSRHGKDLDDDPEYQRRLAAGEIAPPAPPAEIVLQPFAKRSVAIFLAGVAAICIFGLFEGLRPTVAVEEGGVEPMSITPLIQMFMLTAAALILLLCRVKANDVAGSPIFRSGMVAMIALFGIAWMADTFIANNEDAIVELLGSMAENFPFMIAIAIFAVAALTTSQSAATRTMVPLGLALGIGAGYMIAMWTAVVGVMFLPANGTQIAAAEADTTGTTTLGKRVVDHSFQLPLQVCWVATALAGIVIVWLFFGDHTPAPPVPTTPARSVSVRGAAFLGIGAMVGAGIFALLGEAGTVAGSAVWLSFLLAGIVSALLGYTVVKLGVRYPSSGGLIAYLIEGFGNGRLVGIASWLGYFAAIVIVCSMVAVSFGSYATSLFIGDDAGGGLGQRLHDADRARDGGGQHRRLEGRRPRAVADRHRAARRLRRLHRRHARRHRPGPARVQRLPAVLRHRRERRPDVLRVPRLQRDHVRRRRPARPRARAAARRCTSRSA